MVGTPTISGFKRDGRVVAGSASGKIDFEIKHLLENVIQEF